MKVPWPEQGHPRPDEEYEDREPEESTSLPDYTTDSNIPLHNSDVYNSLQGWIQRNAEDLRPICRGLLLFLCLLS